MGQRITFEYVGRLASGEVIDDGEGAPHTIETGRGQVMPRLEEALMDMEIGETRTVRLRAEDAYGQRDPKAIRRVQWSDIPDAAHLPVGEYIAWKNPVSTKPIPAKVLSSSNGWAEIDLNHPLAGMDLEYDLTLIGRTETV